MTPPPSSNLAPSDAVVALRSFPRRYRGVFASVEGDDGIEAMAARLGPDGESAAGVVSDVTRTWAVLTEALRQIVFTDGAVLHPAVGDARQRSWDDGHPDALDDTLVLLGHEADALADLVGRVTTAQDWSREAAVAGGGTVTAIAVLRDAVQVGAAGLAQAEAILRAVRGAGQP
ncbi:MAG TPA: hypothetical protein VIJ47_13845 [Acidimicrobiales bacterium]